MRWSRYACICVILPVLLPASPAETTSVQDAVEKALPLLQKTAPVFWKNTGCVSCHQVTLPTMATALAREHGFAVDNDLEQQILKITADYLELRTERILQGITPPGAEDTLSYVVFGLAMERFPADQATDASARYLKIRQANDGRWKVRAHRPPLEASPISLTAMTIRVLQAYAPPAQQEQYRKSIASAARWLAAAETKNTDESAFKVLGLAWANASPQVIAQGAGALGKTQRPDGGWSQLPTLESDAYATGQVLVALNSAGMKTTDPIYRRGVAFLLKTQLADGSWHVKSRTEAFQPYFESGFPHGHDQWISSAGSSWAVAALALTRPKIEVNATRAKR
jgi:squalene cyclase